MVRSDPVAKVLTRLQQQVRAPQTGHVVRSAAIPTGVSRPVGARMFGVDRATNDAIKAAVQTLRDDLRFEHLAMPDVELWSFVCWAAFDRRTNHSNSFVTEHAREPETLDCQIPVPHLAVTAPTTIGTVQLLPVDDINVRHVFEDPTQPACIATVMVTGTNGSAMAGRAADDIRHHLRQLRHALGDKLHRGQLQFTLGRTYTLPGGRHGTLPNPLPNYGLIVGPESLGEATASPVWTVPTNPRTGVHRQAILALTWLDRAALSEDLSVGMLFAFFALEALLGDNREGLKADAIAYRQVLLSHVARDAFPHPNRAWNLYDLVRSAAVHGETVPDVAEKTLATFIRSVRETLVDYLQVTSSQHIARRSKLLSFLDEHEDRGAVIDWIVENGGPDWIPYFDRMRGRSVP